MDVKSELNSHAHVVSAKVKNVLSFTSILPYTSV